MVIAGSGFLWKWGSNDGSVRNDADYERVQYLLLVHVGCNSGFLGSSKNSHRNSAN